MGELRVTSFSRLGDLTQGRKFSVLPYIVHRNSQRAKRGQFSLSALNATIIINRDPAFC